MERIRFIHEATTEAQKKKLFAKVRSGETLLANSVEIGSYSGLRTEVYYDMLNTHYCLNLCGKAKHKVELGSDVLGNLTQIENELAKIPLKLEATRTKRTEIIGQLQTAKAEIEKPVVFEDELHKKTK